MCNLWAQLKKCCWLYTYMYYNYTQPFYGSMDFVWDNPDEKVPEKTFTHSHLSWSSVIPYLLLPSDTIHGILLVQSTCLTDFFHSLCPGFLWSTSWSGTLYFILQSLSSFRNACPYHRSLFCCSTEIMSSNPTLSLNSLLGILFLVVSRHTSI